MKGMGTIFRRETSAYFNSALAYIFIIVFVLLSTLLFMFITKFFAYPRADMSGYFGLLTVVLCIFVPAATMRIWAEDRKENTIEMLCTFPIKPFALVMGKYLAALVFYLAALACTWVLPLMMEILGEPDWGVIFTSYLGALLIGALFLAVGTFISGLCRDQVTAFVIAFLACAFASLAGWDVFVEYADGTMMIGEHGLGTLLKNIVGITGHYIPFMRGIIELADVLFFLLWTVLFLFLNGTYLEGRSRPKMNLIYPVTVVLCIAIGVLVNQVMLSFNLSIARFDLTENRIYTISDSSRKILRRLDVPVHVNIYITRPEKMPVEYKDLERQITDKIDEIRVAAGGKLKMKVRSMDAKEVVRAAKKDKKEGEEKSLEERLLDKGVKPFSVQYMRGDEAGTKLIYSSIGIEYREKEEQFIPRVLPENIFELEYKLVSMIYKLTQEEPAKIVVFAPIEELPPHLMQMYMQRGMTPPAPQDMYSYVGKLLDYERYEVQRVKLTQKEQMPEHYDALFVINPRSLNKRQQYEIARALYEGKPTLLAAQPYRWNYRPDRDSMALSKVEDKPRVNDFLKKYGLEIEDSILMDSNHEPVRVQDPSNPLSMFTRGTPVDIPTHVVVNPSSMNPDVSITNRLGPLPYMWGARLNIDQDKIRENKLEVTTLIRTSPKAWTLPAGAKFSEKDFEPPADASQMTLAVMVKGQFPNAYPGDEIPSYPREAPMPGMPPPDDGEQTEPAPELTPAPGTLILIGCATTFHNQFLGSGGVELLMNSADALTLGEELIHIRSKRPIDRTIDQPEEATRNLWKFLILTLMNIVVAGAGFSRWALRRSGRRRYRSSFARKEGE